jgi:two-component system NtrC family response regulator
MNTKRLLVVDDEASHRLMIRAVMADRGWHVDEAEDGPAALAALETATGPGSGARLPDVVLLDMKMPGMDGLEVLRQVRQDHPALPVIMLTAFGSVGPAVEAMKQGAFDYLTKPVDNDELEAVLVKAAQYRALLSENENLRSRVADQEQGPRIIGQSAAICEMNEIIAQAAPTEARVLILGESGTGKELVADKLHALSLRSSGPMVKVNCAALPGDLLESELFGYVKGAFTGAVKDKPGRFQLASGGTLFLDEIGEMPQALQAKLLRVLQEGVVEPLGGTGPVPVDVRVLAATNRDLPEEIKAGNFREDLYFRLNVLEIRIPSLRQRKADIPLLTSFLLRRLAKKNHLDAPSVSPDFLDALSQYDWPGNVRELENALERTLVLARAGSLTIDLLPAGFTARMVNQEKGSAGTADDSSVSGAANGQNNEGESGGALPSFDDAERKTLEQALETTGGHRERTAEMLGVSRRTLQYKLKKYGLTKR